MQNGWFEKQVSIFDDNQYLTVPIDAKSRVEKRKYFKYS